jgi:hypothetical protein
MSSAKGLSNVYIQKVAGKHARHNFAGTFSCNTIPQTLAERDSFSFVCNLDKAGEAGSHFIAVVADKNTVIYIDPLGIPCNNGYLKSFLVRCNRRIVYNERTIQHPLSSFCGFYALLYVLYFDCSISHNLQLIFSDTALEDNDGLCVEYLKHLLKLSKG